MLALFAVAATAHAGPLNGGFETGLTPWSTTGQAAVESASFGSTPTEGVAMLSLDTKGAASSDATIETFLGLSAGALDALSATTGINGGGAIEGAAVKQTFVATAGHTMSFDWNFLTDTPPEGTADDFAFVTLTGPAALQVVLTHVSGITRPASGTPFAFESGFQTFQHTFTASGTYTLGIGVLDEGTTFQDSGLLVDNLVVVPEPGATALAGVALAFVCGWRQRRIRSAA